MQTTKTVEERIVSAGGDPGECTGVSIAARLIDNRLVDIRLEIFTGARRECIALPDPQPIFALWHLQRAAGEILEELKRRYPEKKLE